MTRTFLLNDFDISTVDQGITEIEDEIFLMKQNIPQNLFEDE